jgi:hypothetical protein
MRLSSARTSRGQALPAVGDPRGHSCHPSTGSYSVGSELSWLPKTHADALRRLADQVEVTAAAEAKAAALEAPRSQVGGTCRHESGLLRGGRREDPFPEPGDQDRPPAPIRSHDRAGDGFRGERAGPERLQASAGAGRRWAAHAPGR